MLDLSKKNKDLLEEIDQEIKLLSLSCSNNKIEEGIPRSIKIIYSFGGILLSLFILNNNIDYSYKIYVNELLLLILFVFMVGLFLSTLYIRSQIPDDGPWW